MYFVMTPCCLAFCFLFMSLTSSITAFGIRFGNPFRKLTHRLHASYESESRLPLKHTGDPIFFWPEELQSVTSTPEDIAISADMLSQNSSRKSSMVLSEVGRLSMELQNFQKLGAFSRVLYPSFVDSPAMREKWGLNLTPSHLLKGLPNVVEMEYLKSLPVIDPRRRLISTIKDPGPERRAELEENVAEIDAALGPDRGNLSVREVYARVQSQWIDSDYVYGLSVMIGTEHVRKQLVGYMEYDKNESAPARLADFDRITDFVLHLSPGHNFELEGEDQLRLYYYLIENEMLVPRRQREEYYQQLMGRLEGAIAFMKNVISPAIELSSALKEKYPNPEDRLPENLLRGWLNMLEIDFLRSLKEHDQRKFFLDTIAEPGPERRAQLEEDVQLIDAALRESDPKYEGLSPCREICTLLVQYNNYVSYVHTLNYFEDMEFIRRQQDEYMN